MLKFKVYTVLLLIVFSMSIVPVFAADPCGAELCLSSYKAAKMAIGCNKEIDAFFSIKKKRKHHGHKIYDKAKTYRDRRKYLYQCDSGNTEAKERIMAKYGFLESKP